MLAFMRVASHVFSVIAHAHVSLRISLTTRVAGAISSEGTHTFQCRLRKTTTLLALASDTFS